MAGGWKWILLIAIMAVYARLKFFASDPFPQDSENKLQKSEIIVTTAFLGPESLAFDAHGQGPYTGVADGRVMRWNGPEGGWTEFAVTSPKRSEVCNPSSPVVLNFELEPLCGRPLGLRFDKLGNLYIADAYYGLNVVGPEGGLAKPLVTQVDGVPLAFTNDVEIGEDGVVYFTDSSSKYNRRDYAMMFWGGDDSGRLLTFNPTTSETKVLSHGLHMPNGIALSEDESFLVMSETLTCRILRYWLKGPRAGTLEHFAAMPGTPDNIRRTKRGDFWVALHARPNMILKLPWVVRRAILKLPLSVRAKYSKISARFSKGCVIRLSPDGEILEVLEDQQGKVVTLVSEVEEKDGKLWLGSVILPQVAYYHYQ